MVRTDAGTMISGDSPCCWNFGRSEVGIRLSSGALLLPLDPVLVAALSFF
jgi:hypothetical protein